MARSSISASRSSSAGYIANSDYTLYNVLFQTRLQPAHNARVDIQLGYNDKKYGANTFYSARYPSQYEETSTYMASVRGELGDVLKIIPIAYFDRHYDRFELTRGSAAGRNHHRSDVAGGNLILAHRSRLGNTSLAFDLRRENIISSVLGKPMASPEGEYLKSDSRTSAGLALEHSLAWSRWSVSAGALLHRVSPSAGEALGLYPSASLVYRPVDALKLSASWGRSTRMPTFTDLYYTTATHNGNSGLRPEKSESLEAGIRYTRPMAEAYLTAFLLWGRDMIDWVKTDPQDTKWASWNLTKVNTRGAEAGIRLRLSPWLGESASLSLDYARMHQTSDAQGLTSLNALSYLRDKFTARLSHQVGRLSADWYFRFQKRMGTYEKFEGLEKVGNASYPPFSVLDLKLSYKYRFLGFHISINNLYNTHYFDRGNIPQPGLWLMGGVSVF
jgi:iron complex outermembrane receptor protein